MAYFQATLGIIAFIGIAVALSEKRRLPNWRLIAGGLGLQFLFAWLVFRFEFVQAALRGINQFVQAITMSVGTGTAFVFGCLGGDPANVAYPFELSDANATVILTYAFCGFANPGIMIAGLSVMRPEQRGGEIVELAMPALVSGTLATCMAGAGRGIARLSSYQSRAAALASRVSLNSLPSYHSGQFVSFARRLPISKYSNTSSAAPVKSQSGSYSSPGA